MKKHKSEKIIKIALVVFVSLLIIILLAFVSNTSHSKSVDKKSLELKSIEKTVREPTAAGQFYPAEKEELSLVVEKAFELAEKKTFDGEITALIVPHAGYIYSGLTAAQGFTQLEKEYKTVFIIASNHNSNAIYSGISVPDVTHYKTPFGEVKVSPLAKKIKADNSGLFTTNTGAHSAHIVEVEIPFLQKKLGDFEIIPMVTGFMTGEQIVEAAKVVQQYMNDETLIVISTDLSHYHPYDEAKSLDQPCIENIAKLDIEKAKQCEACGLSAILILLNIAKNQGYNAEILGYTNSGDTAGDKSRVVGYGAIVFYGAKGKQEDGSQDKGVSKEGQEFLLKLARSTLENYVKERKTPVIKNVDILPEELAQVQGCFVTLEKSHMLRGCIGHILPQEELYQCVIENAVNAAANDARFNPVTVDELGDITIEVSVLSVPEKLEHKTAEDVLNFMVPLKHGVVLKKGLRQSTYLPQVWSNFATKEEFLSALCEKGGMASDCWQNEDTDIFTYTAQVFHEAE